MPKFSVTIFEDRARVATVEIEAVDADEAFNLGLELGLDNDDIFNGGEYEVTVDRVEEVND